MDHEVSASAMRSLVISSAQAEKPHSIPEKECPCVRRAVSKRAAKKKGTFLSCLRIRKGHELPCHPYHWVPVCQRSLRKTSLYPPELSTEQSPVAPPAAASQSIGQSVVSGIWFTQWQKYRRLSTPKQPKKQGTGPCCRDLLWALARCVETWLPL